MELNILSQLIFELMVLITTALHLFLPRGVEPMAAAFMIGNLFAIYVFPFSVIWGCFNLMGITWVLPYCAIVYMVTILLDKSHLHPPDTKRCPKISHYTFLCSVNTHFKTCGNLFRYSHFRKLNWVHTQSLAFWTSHFSYFPMTVKFGAGAQKAIDPNKQYIFGVRNFPRLHHVKLVPSFHYLLTMSYYTKRVLCPKIPLHFC